MTHCIDIPLSWLQLELHALGEIANAKQKLEVESHLHECTACQASFQLIIDDQRVLPPLSISLATEGLEPPLPPAKPTPWWHIWINQLKSWWNDRTSRLAVLGGTLVVVAAVLFLVIPRPQAPAIERMGSRRYRARVTVKGGGALIVSLVRERAGVISKTPTDYRKGDRFKLSITCADFDSESSQKFGNLGLDVVVIQAAELFRPLGTPIVHCGNNVLLPGAFTATGYAPLEICVAPSHNRERPLSQTDLEGAACITIRSPQ